MSSCCDLDLENSMSNFLHDTSTHNDAPQYQIWKQNVWWLEDIMWTNINVLTLCCDLDPECSNPFFFHRELWLMMTYHQTKFGCQVINSLENIVAVVVARNSISQIPTFLIHSTLFFQILSLLLPAFGMANSFSPHGPAKQNRSCCSQSTVKSD